MIYLRLFLVALVTIYIVDLSGFTESWRSALAKSLHVAALRPLRPFDCGKCMTWWVCLLFPVFTGEFSLGTVAFAALLSHLSVPLGAVLVLMREWINWVANKLMP